MPLGFIFTVVTKFKEARASLNFMSNDLLGDRRNV